MQTGRPHAACTAELQHSAAVPCSAVLRLMQSDSEQNTRRKTRRKQTLCQAELGAHQARAEREAAHGVQRGVGGAFAAAQAQVHVRQQRQLAQYVHACARAAGLRGGRGARRRPPDSCREWARGARRPNSLKQHQTVLWQPSPCLVLDLIRRCWSSRPLRRRRPGPAKESARAIPLPDGQARARGPGRGGRSRGGAHST